MKHTFWSTLALLGLLVAGPRMAPTQARAAQADDAPAAGAKAPQPLFVVSIGSYQAWLNNVNYFGELHQKPYGVVLDGMEKLITGGEGLIGWEKDKPAGVVVNFSGALGFLPISNLDDFLKAVAAFEPKLKDVGDGVREIEMAGQKQPIYLKPAGSWVWVSNSPLAFNNLPQDPVSMLGGLNKKYDLAARINLQSLPQPIVQMALMNLQQGAEDFLKPEPNESEEEFEARKASVMAQIDGVKEAVKDLDQITAGLKIDRGAKKLFFDLEMTFVPGSASAKQIAAASKATSDFAGFRDVDGLVSAGFVAPVADSDREQLTALIGQFRAAANKRIEKLDDLKDDATRAQVKQVVGGLLDNLESAVNQDQLDGGMAIVGDGPYDLVLGMRVGDGSKAGRNLLAGIEMLRDYGVVSADEPTVLTEQGVRIESYKLTLPAEVGRNLHPFFGENATLTVASGPKAVYAGMGETTAAALKKILATSAANASKPASPFEFTMSVGQMIKASNRGNADAPGMAALAKSNIAPGTDVIRAEQRVIKNGAAFRLEVEEGVLKLMGSAAGGRGGPGF